MVLERVQRRATKFILNDFTSDYKTRLRSLNLLPLMMTFELQDLIFFIKAIKTSDPSFNILDYVSFSTNTTRSGAGLKLRHSTSTTNLDRHFYYNRLPRLWNSLPVIHNSLSQNAVLVTIKNHFWSTFKSVFISNHACTFHSLCPCNLWLNPSTPNFS